jgi:hypothetical protein
LSSAASAGLYCLPSEGGAGEKICSLNFTAGGKNYSEF